MSKLKAIILMILVILLLAMQFIGVDWKQWYMVIIPLVVAFIIPNIYNKKDDNDKFMK